jgi:hypothetical protein
MTMPRFASALAVLLLAGCAQTWQAPAGMSPATQASDREACEDDARQAATEEAACTAPWPPWIETTATPPPGQRCTG